jgi:threonyl-tRNA synthetase
MTEISVSLQDGESKSFPQGATVAEIVRELVSSKQRKQTVAVRCNGRILDLSTPLTENGTLEPISVHSEAGQEILRHSTAHIMALAVKELYGKKVKVAIGPAIEDGFYYDFDREKPFSPDEFEQIENKMTEIVNNRLPFLRREMSREEAIAYFEQLGEIYKVELLGEMEADTVSLYSHGDFVDLCRGPHVPDSSWLKVFKLLRVAGSYWRGDEKRQMLTRIYGTTVRVERRADGSILRVYAEVAEDEDRVPDHISLL